MGPAAGPMNPKCYTYPRIADDEVNAVVRLLCAAQESARPAAGQGWFRIGQTGRPVGRGRSLCGDYRTGRPLRADAPK
jgi:hypothetical protein